MKTDTDGMPIIELPTREQLLATELPYIRSARRVLYRFARPDGWISQDVMARAVLQRGLRDLRG